MKKLFITLFILSFLGASLAYAGQKECSNIDIRKDVGPIRDQGDIGWCYANAAADLLSYEYKDQLHGQQASAVYMALTFTDSYIGQNFFEGGSAYFALKAYAARHKNVCLQREEEKVLNNGLHISLKHKLDELMRLKSTFDVFAKNRSQSKPFVQQWWKLKNADSYLFSMGDNNLRELLATSTTEDFPDNVADTLCANSSIPVNQKSDVAGRLTYQNEDLKDLAIQDINRQLNRKNIVGLAYQASVLVDPQVNVDINSAHLSVLVGRRWNNNQCEYLIRNSWGTGCGAYQKSPVFKKRCEGDGHVWIPESVMKKSMIGISYYDKNPSIVSKTATALIQTAERIKAAVR
jgi:hypothetical protein